jgi:Cytochrome c
MSALKIGRLSARKFWTVTVAVLLIVGALAATGWYKLLRQVPVQYASDEDQFKYGSVGTEEPQGIPYYVWKVLPSMFPEKLHGSNGYASFGMIWEEHQDTPIGFPKVTIGFPRLGINCALCHTGTYRMSASDKDHIVLGAPSTTFDLQRYLAFLTACASDAKFTPENVLEAIKKERNLSWLDGILYRFLIIPQTKAALLKQKDDLAWMKSRPDSGPGRVDPFNPAKFAILKLPDDHSIGNSDMVALWNWKARAGFGLHWDGLSTSLTEIFLNSGIGNGASSRTINLTGLKRVQDFVTRLDPPKYPFPVDADLAAQGSKVFAAQCLSCHSFGQRLTGQPLPLSEVGTDPERFNSWTKEAAEAFNNLKIYPWRYSHFRKTDGYVSAALDGLWLRAPYLHNGSVPSLTALLTAPDERPKKFFRGYDVYDQANVGFISDGPDAARVGFEYNTSLPGNGNQGHTYGTNLRPEEKQALVEYLKTL